MASHKILGGKVRIYRRPESSVWQCATYLEGKERRVSTKTDSLSTAKDFAEDWYLDLRGKKAAGLLKVEKTFRDAAKLFEREYLINTAGERNPRYVQDHFARLRNYLLPFFGDTPVREVTSGLVQNYRTMRSAAEDGGKKPSRSTLHHEAVTIRQVMKVALRHGWIDHLPDFSMPYRSSTKITHRAWFSPEEYRQLYTATRERVKQAQGQSRQWAVEQLHDYILFMANTGLRPDEANRLEYRDVAFDEDEDSGERILLIDVRGKRGVGYCKSTSGAVHPFERLIKRNRPKPTDLVFPADHKKQFHRILVETGLKTDRQGNRRSSYSLRHTYICLRLMEGADIYQIAKNCRTSVEMIEKYYAAHISNSISAAAINVRRPVRSKSHSPTYDEMNAHRG